MIQNVCIICVIGFSGLQYNSISNKKKYIAMASYFDCLETTSDISCQTSELRNVSELLGGTAEQVKVPNVRE